ncbi:MAG: NUDIX domain-containing protein [Bacteroidales bacterium]|jgi:NADH pyrophosphatase NudC (nudix superfamily)|nr:NUDIX domain-containing protein [Bacteroidales bacterium]
MNPSFPSELLHFCPYCGADAFRASEENYLQCGVCSRKFFINASAAVACVIVNPQKEILFTRRRFEPAKGLLDLPGGFVNSDETAEDAARREVHEELNLHVDALRYFGSSPNRYICAGMLYYTLDLGFECMVSDFSAIQAGDDVEQFLFVPYNAIDLTLFGFPSIRKLVEMYKMA